LNENSKIWKSLLRLATRVLHNRPGQALFVIHSVFVVYAFTERGSALNPPVHFHYESFWIKALITLDLPALILASVIASPVAHEGSPLAVFWWAPLLAEGIALLCASIQWWFVGYLIARLFRRSGPIAVHHPDSHETN
jgi:hypothetical protein